MMQWIQAHQVMLLVMWPVLTAVASLVYKSLDGNPRWHALFSLLASVGIDLPKLWDGLGRLFTGNPPNGGAGTGAMKGKETMTFPKKPAVMRVALVAIALSLTGCPHGVGPIPQRVINDFEGLVVCIAENGQSLPVLLQKCGQWSIDEIIAALQWLLANPGYAKEHPEMMDTLKARLLDARARAGGQ